MITHHPFAVITLETLENKMATPWCSLITISSIYNSFLTLSSQQGDPTKGPVPIQGHRHFHSLCETCSLSPQSKLSLCSRFSTSSRKALPSTWPTHSVLLNAHPNPKSLSAASVQEEMHNYLRTNKNTYKSSLCISLRNDIWFLAVLSFKHTNVTSLQGLSGCCTRAVTQDIGFELATAFTSEIYNPWLIDDPLCALGMW